MYLECNQQLNLSPKKQYFQLNYQFVWYYSCGWFVHHLKKNILFPTTTTFFTQIKHIHKFVFYIELEQKVLTYVSLPLYIIYFISI